MSTLNPETVYDWLVQEGTWKSPREVARRFALSWDAANIILFTLYCENRVEKAEGYYLYCRVK